MRGVFSQKASRHQFQISNFLFMKLRKFSYEQNTSLPATNKTPVFKLFSTHHLNNMATAPTPSTKNKIHPAVKPDTVEFTIPKPRLVTQCTKKPIYVCRICYALISSCPAECLTNKCKKKHPRKFTYDEDRLAETDPLCIINPSNPNIHNFVFLSMEELNTHLTHHGITLKDYEREDLTEYKNKFSLKVLVQEYVAYKVEHTDPTVRRNELKNRKESYFSSGCDDTDAQMRKEDYMVYGTDIGKHALMDGALSTAVGPRDIRDYWDYYKTDIWNTLHEELAKTEHPESEQQMCDHIMVTYGKEYFDQHVASKDDDAQSFIDDDESSESEVSVKKRKRDDVDNRKRKRSSINYYRAFDNKHSGDSESECSSSASVSSSNYGSNHGSGYSSDEDSDEDSESSAWSAKPLRSVSTHRTSISSKKIKL